MQVLKNINNYHLSIIENSVINPTLLLNKKYRITLVSIIIKIIGLENITLDHGSMDTELTSICRKIVILLAK